MTISRLRAGLAIMFAVVSLMAGAQAAQACTEPALGDLPARGEEQQLVRFELTGMTPGSEYLLKVNGRERKSGIATTDKVERRFRMPRMGDSNRRVKVEVVVANDGCENSPWKFQEKMTYKPEPTPSPTAEPTPSPAPAPAPKPEATPSPPPAPAPPSPPSADSTPAPQPPVPAPAIKPPTPAPAPPVPTEPDRDAKGWITPLDPYSKQDNPPAKVNQATLARTDQPSNIANSTAALIGLGGIFFLLAGGAAIAWTKFRRYDDDRLDEIMNPEGKLPTHLDPKAKDMKEGAGPKKRRRFLPWRKAPTVAAAAAGAAAGATVAAADKPEEKKKGRIRRWLHGKPLENPYRKGLPPKITDEERATLSPEEIEKLKAKRRKERQRMGRKRKAPLPTFDPTAPTAPPAADTGAAPAAAVAAAGAAAAAAADKPEEKKRGRIRRWLHGKPLENPYRKGLGPKITDEERATLSPEEIEKLKAKRRKERQRMGRKRKAPLPTFDPTAPPPVAATPPPQPNGDASAAPPPAAEPEQPGAQPDPNGHAPQPSYRAQVETELQRILNDAGLHTEVDGILAEVKAEAERQGVEMDSELMLQALCDETNGSAKLSDSTRGELQSRFRRIVEEEGEQGRSSPGGQPPRG